MPAPFVMAPNMNSKRVITGVLLAAVVAGTLTGCGNAQTRKASYFERGERYFAAHHYEKAGVEFRNALQIDPNFLEPGYALLIGIQSGIGRSHIGLRQSGTMPPRYPAIRPLSLSPPMDRIDDAAHTTDARCAPADRLGWRAGS